MLSAADDDEEATAIDENFDDYDRESSVLTTGGGDCDNDELFFQRSPQLRRRDDDDGGCCDVSSRYDTCIVYALDECLTRGTYRLFAQWLCRYLTRENLPGCLTIVGFSKRRRRGVEDDCYPVGRDTVNLGPRRNRDDYDGNGGSAAGGNEIPYIRLNPNDRYAIFDFKRQTGYPTIVLLVTLPSSRMELCLSCDGAILVHARHTLRRNMIDVADVLRHLNRDYLEDLYTRINADRNYDNDEECCVTDEATAGECTINGGGTGGCLIGFERRRDGEVAAIDEPPPSRFDGGASVAAVDDDDHPVAPFSSTQQWWSGGGGGDGGNVISWIHQPPRQPVVECADENWEDRLGKERIEISEQGDRISPPRLITAAARNGSTFEHTENAAVAKLNIHNRTLLNDLKRMDATLTNTHSIDRLPVIHGESIDVYS